MKVHLHDHTKGGTPACGKKGNHPTALIRSFVRSEDRCEDCDEELATNSEKYFYKPEFPGKKQ